MSEEIRTITAEHYLAVIEIEDEDIISINEDAWNAVENLRESLGETFPQEVRRLANKQGHSLWLSGYLAVLIGEVRARRFACDCAERVLHVFERACPGDDRPKVAIETARRFARGEASAQELAAARDEAATAGRNTYPRPEAGAAFAAAGAAMPEARAAVPAAYINARMTIAQEHRGTESEHIKEEQQWQTGRLWAYTDGEVP